MNFFNVDNMEFWHINDDLNNVNDVRIVTDNYINHMHRYFHSDFDTIWGLVHHWHLLPQTRRTSP